MDDFDVRIISQRAVDDDLDSICFWWKSVNGYSDNEFFLETLMIMMNKFFYGAIKDDFADLVK